MKGNDRLLGRLDQSGVPLLLARLVLAVMFIYLGSVKIADPIEFLKQLRLFHLLPESPPLYLNLTAVVLPWLEVIVGTALLAGLHVRGAFLATVVMFSVFTPAIVKRALHVQAEQDISFFDVKFDCGCGAGPVVIWKKLLENAGLFCLAWVGLLSRSTRFFPARWIERRMVRADMAPTR